MIKLFTAPAGVLFPDDNVSAEMMWNYGFSKKLTVFALSLIISLPIISPKTYAQQSVTSSVKTGLEYCYNFKWEQADNTFKKIIRTHPDDPRGYHYEASIYFWYYFSNQDKKDYRNFLAYSDTAIDAAVKKLEDDPDNPDILYMLGADYSYRTMAFTKAEKFLDAVWASKKSESLLNKALEIDSTKYDAYLGLGLYNFAVSQIPTAFKWALSLAGIRGDKETGLRYLRLAAHKGNYSKVEAQFYLSQILSNFLFDFKGAASYLTTLLNRYPDNLLFNYSYAVIKIKQKKLADAKKILRTILNAKETPFTQLLSFSNFLMGDVFYRMNKFDSAKIYYSEFLRNSKTKDYHGIAAYRLGVSYELTGDREEALDFYRAAGGGNMGIEDDIYAERKGNEYLERPISPDEAKLIRFDNTLEGARYKAAYDSLSVLLDSCKTDTLKAQVYIGLSRGAYRLGKYADAADYAMSAKLLDADNENWIKPYSCYYAARAYMKTGNEKEADSLIEKARDYSDYDYQKKLDNLLYTLEHNR